jgi:hypothetical protein
MHFAEAARLFRANPMGLHLSVFLVWSIPPVMPAETI